MDTNPSCSQYIHFGSENPRQRSSINIQQRANSRGFLWCCTGAITSRIRGCHPLNVVVVVFQYLILKQLHLLLVYFVYPILLNPVILISILRGHFSSLTYQLIKANDDDEDEDEREMTDHPRQVPLICHDELFTKQNELLPPPPRTAQGNSSILARNLFT